MTELEKVRLETVKFMRGKYRLDELGNGKNELKFKQGQKTILTVYIHEDKYTFLVIFGKKEREIFETQRSGFSPYIQNYYDNSTTYHDGKWMFIDVTTTEQLEEVKRLIIIKKKPNRKPLPKENAVYGKCGHRCDLCVHYTGISEEFREMLIPHLIAVYGDDSNYYTMRCTGCDTPGCHCCGSEADLCEPLKCLCKNKAESCLSCKDYPCGSATVGYRQLESRSLSADDITWAILPYVPKQYEE